MSQHHVHETQASRGEAARAEQAAIRAAYRATFGTEQGGRVLSILRASAGCAPGAERPCFLPSPGGGPLDPLAAAFRDGRKSILAEIDSILLSAEDGEPGGPAARR